MPLRKHNADNEPALRIRTGWPRNGKTCAHCQHDGLCVHLCCWRCDESSSFFPSSSIQTYNYTYTYLTLTPHTYSAHILLDVSTTVHPGTPLQVSRRSRMHRHASDTTTTDPDLSLAYQQYIAVTNTPSLVLRNALILPMLRSASYGRIHAGLCHEGAISGCTLLRQLFRRLLLSTGQMVPRHYHY